MLSMCLGMVADFDERAGDHAAAITALEEAIATNDALGLRGFTGSLLARLGWALLHDGDLARAEATYERALEDGPPAAATRLVLFLALTGMAVAAPAPRRDDRRGRGRDRGARALPGRRAPPVPEPHRPRRPCSTAAAACCAVLAVVAAEAATADEAARLLGHAERLRDDAGAPVPPFQQDDIERARALAVARSGRRLRGRVRRRPARRPRRRGATRR